ncbi:MAG: hypothetical protein AAGJ35_01360, partial [Myxococcota bacterium]
VAVAKQLRRNFRGLVGTIQLLPAKSFLEKPGRNGVELGSFSFQPWRVVGANGLIKVSIRAASSKQIRLMLRFYSVDRSKQIVRVSETVSTEGMRWSVHRFSNAVYKHLTGQEGLFTSYIAYVKRGPRGGKDIWVMDVDGQNQRCVVRNGAINMLPSWSPSGRYLVFTSYMEGRPYLYKLDLRTEQLSRLSRLRGNYTGGVFSPTGKRIAFSVSSASGSHLYLGTPKGKVLKRLTKSWGIHISPTWSADGKFLAFVSERFATPQIFVMRADGSNQTRLTFKGDYNQEPQWSPKQPEILFTARDEYLKYDLFVIRLEQDDQGRLLSKYRRLTQNQGRNFEATWSPDGRFVLFVSTRKGRRQLYIMNADGSKQRIFLKLRGNVQSPAWSPSLRSPLLPGGARGRSFYRRVRKVGFPPLREMPEPKDQAKPPTPPPTAPATRGTIGKKG